MIKLQAGAQDHVCDSVYIYMYIDIYIKFNTKSLHVSPEKKKKQDALNILHV